MKFWVRVSVWESRFFNLINLILNGNLWDEIARVLSASEPFVEGDEC